MGIHRNETRTTTHAYNSNIPPLSVALNSCSGGLIMLCTFSGEFQNKRMRSFLFLSAQVTSLLLYIPSDKADFTTGDERHTTSAIPCMPRTSPVCNNENVIQNSTPPQSSPSYFIVPKIYTDMKDGYLTHFLRVAKSAIESSKRPQSHHTLTNHP